MAKIPMSKIDKKLTAKEKREIEAAAKKKPVADEDCPVMTEEQLKEFKRINRENRTKQTVSLRISPETLKKAKRYGKGYTGLLSRLLDEVIDDEELIRKCL